MGRENERETDERWGAQYDDDSIGAAIDSAFDDVIHALNELRALVKQL